MTARTTRTVGTAVDHASQASYSTAVPANGRTTRCCLNCVLASQRAAVMPDRRGYKRAAESEVSSQVNSVTAAMFREAEEYLRACRVPEDAWILESQQSFFKMHQVAGRLFGMEETAIRALLRSGQIPGAVMPTKYVGWSLPRSGLIYYMAQVRRAEAERQRRRNSGD